MAGQYNIRLRFWVSKQNGAGWRSSECETCSITLPAFKLCERQWVRRTCSWKKHIQRCSVYAVQSHRHWLQESPQPSFSWLNRNSGIRSPTDRGWNLGWLLWLNSFYFVSFWPSCFLLSRTRVEVITSRRPGRSLFVRMKRSDLLV